MVERIEAASGEAASLRSEQAECYKALARLKLDELKQTKLTEDLDDAERRAFAAIDEHKAKLTSIADRYAALTNNLSDAQDRRSLQMKAVETAHDAIVSQETETAKRLTDNVEWQAQTAKLSGAKARAEAAEQKAQQAETDRDEKSKPYLADKLFVYLWNRGYGTSAYRGGALARLGDGYVARVVSYEPARQNYFMLTEIPKRLREHADRLKVETDEEKSKLSSIERKTLEADGIVELETSYSTANADLNEVSAVIAETESKIAVLEKERDETQREGLERAVDDLAASLRHESFRALLQEARATPTPEDERIVGRLQTIDTVLDQNAATVDNARKAMADLARKRTELERSQFEFQRSGYDRGGGGFVNDKLIGDIIGGILGGILSSRDLSDAMRSGYRQGRRSSPSINIDFGGSSWGGGSRGGGSGGGDGFTTGGRF